MPRRRYVPLWFLVLLLPFVGPQAWAQAVKDLPRPTDYVSDYAHVLSPAVTQQLDLLCGQVDRQAHAQIAVVTVGTIGDEAIHDYAVQLEDAWKVGAKGTDRGVILLLAVKEKKRWITTGYGLEAILPDGKVGQIGRAMVPYLDGGNYDAAVSLAVNQMAGVIAQDAGVTLQQQPVRRVGRGQQQQVHLGLGQMLVLGVAALVFLFVASRLGLLPFLFGMLLGNSFGGGGGRGRDDDDGGGGGSGFGGFGGGSTGGGGAGGDW